MSLHIIFGPMFAGKTTELINNIQSLLDNIIYIKDQNKFLDDILIINHISDKRYSKNSELCTHDNRKMSCLSLNNLNDLFTNSDINIINKKYIFIDEGQFFSDLYESVKTLLLKHKKQIYIGGLDGDYKQEPFYVSRMFDLIPYASTVKKLNSKCVDCNANAPFTKRIIQSEEQILVGGSDSYKPVCLNHL